MNTDLRIGSRYRIHMSQSVRGALENWKLKDWKRLGLDNDMTPAQMKEAFWDLLSEGKKVIPIGECDNFDYLQGCMGHQVEDEDLT